MYFRYNATSGCVGDNVIETGDIENMDVGVGILFLAVLCIYRLFTPKVDNTKKNKTNNGDIQKHTN